MPVVSIDVKWLNELIGNPVAGETLAEALEQIGCDVEEMVDIGRHRCPRCQALVEAGVGADAVTSCPVCSYEQDAPLPFVDTIPVVRLDLLAARPDLFDIGGLARALKGYLGLVEGLPDVSTSPSDVVVEVAKETSDAKSYRPFIRCAVVHMPPLDDRLLAAIMKLQENLHWGVGRDRKLASIGVYDLDRVKTPITYRTLDPDRESFEPLALPGTRMTGRQILEEHPKGVAYAHLLADHERYPLLIDADGLVLSMPPIINSEGTKVTTGTTRLFVDVTGISEAAVGNALHTLVYSLVELGGRVATVEVRGGGKRRVTPDLTPGAQRITLDGARSWLGLPLDADKLMESLRRMRLDVRPLDKPRTEFEVRYPAFRSDIRHMVDVLEDLAIGYGYQNIVAAQVPTMTVGGPRFEEALGESVRAILLGLGFSEIMSLPLTTEEDHFTKLRLSVPAHYPRVANPKLKTLTVVRTHLITGVMESLRENRRRPMPLKLFEMDNVVVLDEKAETGTREERRLCFVHVGRDAGYASARAALDALLRELGASADYRPSEHSSFTSGRAAEFRAGAFRGVLGELHPEVVVGFGLDHPVALVEMTLADI